MAIMLPILGQINGSVGGLTFFNGRYGMTVRNRVTPVDPGSDPQIEIRSLFTFFSTRWSSALSDADRQTWTNYAANTPMPGKHGSTIFFTGLNHYIRSGTLLRIGGLPDDQTAPTVGGQASQVTPDDETVVVYHDATSLVPDVFRIDLTMLSGYDPAIDGNNLIISVGDVVSPGVFFYKSPFVVRAIVVGNAASPPTTVDVQAVGPANVGDVGFIRFRRINANARAGPPSIFRQVAVNVPI